jgi:hypothetical protein
MWSYKLLTRPGGLTDNAWSIVSNRKPMPLVNMTDSHKEEIEDMFAWFGTMEYCTNQNLTSALQSEFPPPMTLPEIIPLLMDVPHTDALPTGWQSDPIGLRAQGGQKMISPDAITLYAGGQDIWEVDDSFYLLSRPTRGDAALSATLHGVTNTHHYAKAGLMLRGSSAPDAAHLLISAFPNGFVTIGWRAEKGAVMEQINLDTLPFPIRLTLVRKKDQAQVSCVASNGKKITRKFKLSKDFNGVCRLGLAACSRDPHYLTEAPFTEIKLLAKADATQSN